MHAFARRLLSFGFCLAALLAPMRGYAAEPGGTAVAAGERIYREGVTRSGALLRGAGVNGVRLEGRDAACSQCHRRSGFGTAEGAFVVRPISAVDLFQDRAPAASSQRIAHQLGVPVRPPYDDASLALALRAGVDVRGRPLGALMPRYALSAQDMRDLEAYLHTLGATPAPGVDEADLHLAVVIQPGVGDVRRAALLSVLDAFVRDKNAAVRSEPARRRAGAMRMQRAYRRWVLHVWQLEGPPSGWPAQLAQAYAAQPVFAMVSGIGDQDWTPIHRFSEDQRLPCILPLALLPARGEPNVYTIYFSDGLLLEAEGIARVLAARQAPGQPGHVTQVYRSGDAAALAAATLLRGALAHTSLALEDQVLAGAASATALGRADDVATVVWLGAADLARPPPAAPVLLARSLAPDPLPPGWTGARRVGRWDNGPAHQRRLLRALDWMKARAIPLRDEEVQVNAMFAMSMVGEALMHQLDSFSRDYLLESIEHEINVSILPSMYPHLSLGRDLRVAAHEVWLDGEPQPLGASDPIDRRIGDRSDNR
jgi:hypothetical protein